MNNFIQARHKAKKIIRSYFNAHGFIEIDSPILLPFNIPERHINPILIGLKQLRTSPEIYHRQLLFNKYPKTYELGHVFRNETLDDLHAREFTLLEWYRLESPLITIIKDCEGLFKSLAPNIFSEPFEVITMENAWKKFTNINLKQALLNNTLIENVKKVGFLLRKSANFYDAFHHVMITAIEPNIGIKKPCVITRWPRQLAALAKIDEDDNLFAERFEIYFKGVELGNAYFEINNYVELNSRIQEELETINKLGKQIKKPTANKKILVNKKQIPSASGIAIGLDRLLMIILGKKKISHTINLIENKE